MDVSGDNLVSRVREETYLQDRLAALLLAIFSGLIFFDMTAEWSVFTHDGPTHIRWLESLTVALRTGVIYPRWFPDIMLGLGQPVIEYYPPGFYYPPALLHLAGLDLVSGIRVTFSLGFALSAWWMYRLSRLFVSLWPAIVSVVCFQFFPYRIYDLFVRGAFPEFSAFFWLPAVALYTLQAATADKGSSRATLFPKSLTMAGLAWAGLIVTHNLSALMAVLVLGALLTLLFVFQRGIGVSFYQVLVRSGASVALGMLLTAWYILPALLELRWVMNGHGLFSGVGLGHFLEWSELVDLRFFYTYMFPSHRPRLPIYVIPTVIGAVLAASTVRRPKLRLFTFLTLVLTLCLSWLMTDTSTWFWFSVEALIDQVQFPWRWQTFAALGVALLLAASLESLRRSGSNWRTALPLFSLLISAYLFAYATVRLDYPKGDEATTRTHYSDSAESWSWIFTKGPHARHFLPVGSAKSIGEAFKAGQSPWEHSAHQDPIRTAAVTPTRASLLQQRYLVTTEQTFRLLFHQFYFPPWRVTVDGIQVEVQPATAFSLASVVIPPGTHTVEFAWRATTAVWLGRIVTTVGWLVVLILLGLAARATDLLRRGPKAGWLAVWQLRSPLIWLAVGAFMIVAASGVTVRTWDETAIGADYGNIRLESVRSISPVRAGEVAPVRLTWLVTGPGAPVSAFVHLVDEAGMGIGQDDGPPGDSEAPYKIWTPGLILTSTHNITTPDTLPPGRYRLIAGLYYPDQSHEPIVPLNGDNSRLEIGTLEVLP